MQEVFENIIKKLESLEKVFIKGNSNKVAAGIIKAIEIVKQEAEKYEECYKDCGDCEAYNKEKHHCSKFCKEIKATVKEIEDNHNRWIPCSEKLPEGRQDGLVTVEYRGFMGMHGYWSKAGHMEAENDWCGDCAGGEVIAWQPLPKPFKEYD